MAKAIEAAREHRVLIPLLLGSLCGLRRGEILALRWKSVDLERAQLAVVASIGQVGKVCREKETKSSKCRTIAMPSLLVEELRRQRIIQATEMLRCGVGLNADSYVVARQDGERINPRTLTSWVSRFIRSKGQQGSIARPTTQPCQPYARRGCSPESGTRALGTRKHRDHNGYLQPPSAEYARRCRSKNRRGIEGSAEEHLANAIGSISVANSPYRR